MKKLISLLLIAITAITLSSCVIVTNDTPVTYTMYFNNNTDTQYIYDWYVKDRAGHQYVLSDEYCRVPQGCTSSISGLRAGDYQVWFCIYSNPNRSKSDVYIDLGTFVYVNSDVTFNLYEEDYTIGRPYRSALEENESNSKKLVIVDSNGNKYELLNDKK